MDLSNRIWLGKAPEALYVSGKFKDTFVINIVDHMGEPSAAPEKTKFISDCGLKLQFPIYIIGKWRLRYGQD